VFKFITILLKLLSLEDASEIITRNVDRRPPTKTAPHPDKYARKIFIEKHVNYLKEYD
jgi:hypothetical protein